MINIISDDNSIIPYRKELNKITGCVTSSILLSQLLYWWKKSGGEFYKFKEPCKHEKYTEGDSWCEELGYTRKQFDTAFKKLKDNGFASNRVTIDRLTYYSVDERTLGKALKGLYETTETDFTKSDNGTLVYKEAETTTETTADNKYISVSESAKCQGIFDAWNERGVVTHRSMTNSIKAKILKRLREYSNGDLLDAIRNYADVYHSKDTYFSHKWTLEEFMSRDKGMPVFLHKGVPDYLIRTSNPAQQKSNVTFLPRPEND